MEAQEINYFLPVKIIDKLWAEKLLSGSVFMRSLYEFGVWNLDAKINGQANEMNNSFRGDISEGLVKNMNPNTGDSFFNGFPSFMKPYISNMMYVDESYYKFLKIYCMYCLTYNINIKIFEQPDKRLKEFGDTAVIIYNQDEFIKRVKKELNNKFGNNNNFNMDIVSYYDIFKDFGDYDIFWKEKKYEWQKELRMTVGLLNGNETRIDENGRQLKTLIQDINSLTLEIGSINDIAIAIPTEDLINLKLPAIINKMPPQNFSHNIKKCSHKSYETINTEHNLLRPLFVIS